MPSQLDANQKVLLDQLERHWYENDGSGMDAEELREATGFYKSAIPEILAPLVQAGLVEEDNTLGEPEWTWVLPKKPASRKPKAKAKPKAKPASKGKAKKPSANPAGKKRGGAKAPTIGQKRREKGKREAQKMKRVVGASLVLLPGYRYVPLSGKARWRRQRYRKAPAPPSGRAAQDAVALAKRYYVKLVKVATKRRTKSGIVPFKVPFAMKGAAARRRTPEGDLWRAWELCLDAACLAQPAFGSGSLELPQSMRGPVRMDARAVCAFSGADGSIFTTVNGEYRILFGFEIEMAVTPDNIQTLLAVQECVGFGSVRIRSRKEAGYRRFLRFACGGAEAARFVATNWEEFGPKSPVAQLALLALDGAALGRGLVLSKARRDEVLRHRDVLLYLSQEFNLKLNGLGRASRTETDRFYNGLMKGGRGPALDRLAWFWIGDGSAGIYEHNGYVHVSIRFYQSYQSYIEALKRAVADLGLGTLCVSSVPESRLDDDGYSRRRAYEASLQSASDCQKLAKALLAPLRKAGAGHFAKAKILELIASTNKPSKADAAKHARIRDEISP